MSDTAQTLLVLGVVVVAGLIFLPVIRKMTTPTIVAPSTSGVSGLGMASSTFAGSDKALQVGPTGYAESGSDSFMK